MIHRLAANYMLHGTYKSQVRSILAHGLLPGGLKGQRRGEHVHLAAHVAGTGKCAGVGIATDTIIEVDMDQFLEDGGIAYWSATEVLLTEGMVFEDYTDRVGIAPRYLAGAYDRSTGEKVYILQHQVRAGARPCLEPRMNESGDVPGAEKMAEVFISLEESNRIQRSIASTFEQERLAGVYVTGGSSLSSEPCQAPAADAGPQEIWVSHVELPPLGTSTSRLALVNSRVNKVGSGPRPNQKCPFKGLHSSKDLYLRQLCGMPGLPLAWYDHPPGKGGVVVHQGLAKGHMLGPVRSYDLNKDYFTCCIDTPAQHLTCPKRVWVVVWASTDEVDRIGHHTGTSFCDLIFIARDGNCADRERSEESSGVDKACPLSSEPCQAPAANAAGRLNVCQLSDRVYTYLDDGIMEFWEIRPEIIFCSPDGGGDVLLVIGLKLARCREKVRLDEGKDHKSQWLEATTGTMYGIMTGGLNFAMECELVIDPPCPPDLYARIIRKATQVYKLLEEAGAARINSSPEEIRKYAGGTGFPTGFPLEIIAAENEAERTIRFCSIDVAYDPADFAHDVDTAISAECNRLCRSRPLTFLGTACGTAYGLPRPRCPASRVKHRPRARIVVPWNPSTRPFSFSPTFSGGRSEAVFSLSALCRHYVKKRNQMGRTIRYHDRKTPLPWETSATFRKLYSKSRYDDNRN